jgi:hypothetical protein
MPRGMGSRFSSRSVLTVIVTALFLGSAASAQRITPARSRTAVAAPTARQHGSFHPQTVTCGSGTNNWTGGAGNDEWATAGNWSSGAVPISTDNVCIASSFTSTITIGTLAAANQTIASLDAGAPISFTAGPLTISGTATFAADLNISQSGALTLDGTSSMTTLEFSAGTLGGSGALTISGLMTWSGGTLSGSATTTANGGMALSGEPFQSTGTVNNTGIATWTGSAYLMENGAVFNNQSGATWNHEADTLIEFNGGNTPTFNNAGTFEKTMGTSSTGGGIYSQVLFNNTGSVAANSGILLVNDNGTCSGTCGGSWSVASGDTLQLGSGTTGALSGAISGAGTVVFTTGTVNYTGTYNVTGGTQATIGTANFNTGATVTSTGPLNISEDGNLNFSTGNTITTSTLTQSGGTLTGSDTLTVTGATTWSGGTESGTGITNANGGMTISGEPFQDTRTINNTGIATFTGDAYLMLDGAVFNNQSGATWNHEGDTLIEFDGGNTPTFSNAGTFDKTMGTMSTGGGIGGSILFNNTGSVEAKSGILVVSNAGSCTGTCGGSWSVSSGDTLQLGSGTTAALSGAISGAGTVVFNSGTVNYTGAYDVTGGTQAVLGTGNFNTGATVTSAGPLNISEDGNLNFSTGKTITASTLTQSGGTLTGSDTLTVTGATTWSGGTQSGTGTTEADGGMTISGEPFQDTRTITNAKTATFTGDAYLMLDGAVFNNKGTWNHEGDTEIEFDGGSTPTFNNTGTFEKTSGTSTSGGGVGPSINLKNSGTVSAQSGIFLLGNNYVQSKGSTLLDGGNVSVSTSTVTEDGGSLLGSGTLTGGLTNSGGTVGSHLNSTTTGTLNISGSGAGYYTQGASGTTIWNIAGTTAGEFDVVNATGAATLAGTAEFCLIKGAKPAIGTTFPVMTYASETGTFATVTFGYSLTYNSTGITMTYNGAPVDNFSPTKLSFPSTLISTASSPLTVTLKNDGQGTLDITGVTETGTNSGDYTIGSNTCGATLAAGKSCSWQVTFTPAALGTRTADATVTDDSCGSPHLVPESGKGTEVTMAPSPVNFGDVSVGTTSAAMTVTVTNHGTTAVTVKSATLSGTDKSDFTITSNGCTTIAANGGTCEIMVTATPSKAGSLTATLTLTDSDKGSPQTDTVEVTGTD